MPTKRKRVSRAASMTPDREAALWADVFDSGDFLLAGEDRPLGIEFQGRSWEGGEPTEEFLRWREEVLRPAARAAWARLGDEYLAGHIGGNRGAEPPRRGGWALREFGRPSS